MKMVKDKKLVVGADFAGYPLKEAVVAHLKAKGWEIEDVGVKSPDDNDTENMFHRVGLRIGAKNRRGRVRARAGVLRHGNGHTYRGQQVPARTRGRGRVGARGAARDNRQRR